MNNKLKEIDDNEIIIHLSSNLVDKQLKSVQTIKDMFDDNVFTDRKIEGFKRLLNINVDMDNIEAYILANILTRADPTDEFDCTSFGVISPFIVDKALRNLKSYGFLDCSDDDNASSNRKWYSLTKTSWEELVNFGTLTLKNEISNATLKDVSVKDRYLIKYTSIKDVLLYYNDELNKSLNNIKAVLAPENFKGVQERLIEENQHAGVCISFYGPSGTGKTEKVLQIAKELKRDIYNYKIADSESRYCGEKQDVINKMFTNFTKVCKMYKDSGQPEPILLLNEADALFARRHEETNENNTANRENNQLQAELLNHIENFDGIMIITTNQIQNFDDAMERRFLFKIKFNNPDKDTQKKIWKNRFPYLEDKELDEITSKYDFTGGNIQNIKRKSSINYVIRGERSKISDLLELCKDEKIENENARRIGFGF